MAMNISLVAEHQEEYAPSGLRLTVLQQSQYVIEQMHLTDGLDNDGGKLRFGLLVQIRPQGSKQNNGQLPARNKLTHVLGKLCGFCPRNILIHKD